VAALRLEQSALRAFVDSPWRGDPAALASFEKKDVEGPARGLPADAFVVAQFNGDPAALAPMLPQLTGPYLDRAFRESNFDVKSEVFANLHPGIAFSLSVSPNIPLGAGMPDLSVRRTNPFRYAHLVAVAQAKDASKVAPVLGRMPEIAPKFGAKIEPLQREGKTLYVTSYAQGEGVHFASPGEGRVILASPLARLERTLATPADAKGPALLGDPELSKVLTGHAFAAVVDLDALRAAVKALPQDAWGIGGFAIKASAIRWLDATDDLRAITVGVSRREQGLHAEIALRLTQR
jgi:hypothetical protein